MNIDEYLNNLQANLDSQLSNLEIGCNPTNDTPAEQNSLFCPECGTKVVADANFCPNCGYCFNANESEESNSLGESNENEGIIWTDTLALAQKYSVSRQAVLDLLMNFIIANDEMVLIGTCLTWPIISLS